MQEIGRYTHSRSELSAALLLAMAALSFLSGCSLTASQPESSAPDNVSATPSEGSVIPYKPVEDFLAPDSPPSAAVVTTRETFPPKVVALDWNSGVNRSLVPTRTIEWPRVSGDDWQLRIVSASDPSRVVLYRYESVSRKGIPDENAGLEKVCGENANSPCTFERIAGEVVVKAGSTIPVRGYFVVQAAWLDNGGGESSISWVFQVTDLPTG